MKRKIFAIIIVNLAIGVVLISLVSWMLRQGFEESFVALSIFFSLIYILANCLFLYFNTIKN